MKFVLLFFGIILSLSGCSVTPTPKDNYANASIKLNAMFDEELAAYKAAPSCGDKHAADIAYLAHYGLNQNSALLPTLASSEGFEMNRDTSFVFAQKLLQLGDAQVSKGCYAEAKKTYLDVIDTMTGSAYASLREHAEASIASMPRT